MRKQISNRFRDKSIGGETLKESDSNESKAHESGTLSSSNLDTEDEDEEVFRSMSTIKKFTPKSHQKAKKNKWEKFQTRHAIHICRQG